jgi:hypothetical protein
MDGVASVRIIGLLSWYEESVTWLAECVASAARLCDHLVAVDGPYVEFPGALRKPASSAEQAEAILRTAAGAGIGCTIHSPRQPWWGNEVEKRDYMFRLGMTLAQPGTDWFLRIDADETLSDVPVDTRDLLAASEQDVAEVTIWETAGQVPGGFGGGIRDYQQPFRCLFRAAPGIAVRQAHYVVTVPDGRVLAGNPSVHRLEPAEPLWDVRLQHKTQQRDTHRWKQKKSYYDRLPEIEHVEAIRT